MNWLYQAGITLYSAAVKAVTPWHPKARKMIAGQKETLTRLSHIPDKDPRGERIWIHVSSLGEFEQGRPLIEKIRQHRPQATIILSFFSPSGMEVRKNYDRVDTTVYLPFDRRRAVKQFLDTLRPTMAIFVKYEFWGNYLTELHRRHIPTYLISGIFRPSQQFFKPWGSQFRKMLRCFTTLYVQNERSRQLLDKIGITNVVVNGDTRLDRVVQIKEQATDDPLLQQFTSQPEADSILVAGSTWPQDETILFDWLHADPRRHSIIAPHEMDDTRLEQLRQQLGAVSTWLLSRLRQHYSREKTLPPQLRHIIIDCYGLLSTLYRYGTIAYVGGGFGAGIHNINEAAVYGIPVVFGPNYHKFQEAKDLIRLGGAFTAPTADSLISTLDRLSSDPAARHRAGEKAAAYITASKGATDLIYKDLFERRR